jgi:hypothetical protein
VNRLSLTLGLALIDVCWVYPWAVLVGLWSDLARPKPLLSPSSIFGLVMLAALSTQTLGRRAVTSRAVGLGLALLGAAVVLIVVRQDQYPETAGLAWLGLIVGALAGLLGQVTAPALAFGLGLFLWWRGVRLGSQMPTYSDVEGRVRWGIGLLISVALLTALSVAPSVLTSIKAQTTPFVVGFFFVGLITLALGRLESLRSRTRVLALKTEWLGILVGVAGGVVLVALIIGQLVSFDLLSLASRPLVELLGQALLLVLYVVFIPLGFVVEWLVYLLLGLFPRDPSQLPPRPLQPAQVDDALQRLLSQVLPPELLQVLKAGGAAVLLVLGLWLVARAASRWRAPSVDADTTLEERDSLWNSARLRQALQAWLSRLLHRRKRVVYGPASGSATTFAADDAQQVSSVRELYRRLLRLGEALGVPRAIAATPLEHLPHLQHVLEPAEGVARITGAYLDVRYAEHEASSAELAQVRAELEHVHARETTDGARADA